jgi:hypothetical protein
MRAIKISTHTICLPVGMKLVCEYLLVKDKLFIVILNENKTELDRLKKKIIAFFSSWPSCLSVLREGP